MIKVIIFLFYFLIQMPAISYAHALEDFEGVWAGVEVMGGDETTTHLVRSALGLENGTPFSFDETYFDSLCQKAKNVVPEKDISCGFIVYGDGDYYYNVEITDKHQMPYIYRTIENSKQPIQSLPKDLLALHEKLNSRFSELFAAGSAEDIGEHCSNGTLNYGDPMLQAIAKKLLDLCSKYNPILLETIHFSQDPIQRSTAATLLSWANHPSNVEYILKWNLIDDPDALVRNNLTRSLSCVITEVNDTDVLQKMVMHLCKQAGLPSHSDRNKALSTLQIILKKHPEVSDSIYDECKKTIHNIGKTSILVNAGSIARDILKQIDNHYYD